MASRTLIFSVKELSRRLGSAKYDQNNDRSTDHSAIFRVNSTSYFLPDPLRDFLGDALLSTFLVCYPLVISTTSTWKVCYPLIRSFGVISLFFRLV